MNTKHLEQLCARDHTETEWWYYHGHLTSGRRRFGFHLAFFRSRINSVRVPRLLQYRKTGPHVRFAHFAVSELGRREFHYGHQRSFGRHAGAAADCYSVWLGDWFARGTDDFHSIGARIRGVQLNASLTPQKPPITHLRPGALRDVLAGQERYLSYPRMAIDGVLTLNHQPLRVSGEAWMDREAGTFAIGDEFDGWDWFGIQFSDDRELMVYRLWDQDRRQTHHSIAALVSPNGEVTQIDADQIALTPLDFWTSPRTGNVYPLNWRISIPEIDADLRILPFMPFHEMDTRGSTSVIYWEGPAAVEGRLMGHPANGQCFIELFGYDRLPRRLGVIDFSTRQLGLMDGIFNEFWLMVRGAGVRIGDVG